MSILFIAPLPEPITGHSLAAQVFLDGLRRHHAVDVVNVSKATLAPGFNSLARVKEVFGYANTARRAAGQSEAIYFTVSESFAGNLKDLLIYAACAGRLDRMIIHIHGGRPFKHMLDGAWPLLSPLNRWIMNRLACIIILGDSFRDIGDTIRARRIEIVPNFAEDYLFATEEDVRSRFARPGPLTIAYLSNLIPQKGYLQLLDGFLALPTEAKAKVVIEFAGSFEDAADEQAFCERIAPWPQLSWLGVVRGSQKRDMLHRAHVLALPSFQGLGEGQPICILEAYASGAAVMATAHGGIVDIFTPGVNGLALEKRSAASISKALLAALADRERLCAIGLHNLADATANYRVSAYQSRLLAIIESVRADAAAGRAKT